MAYEVRISDWSSDVCSSDLTNKDGTLEVDTEALDAALKANPAAVTAMINPAVEDAANPGLAGAMKSVQDKLQDEDSGALVRAQERYKGLQEKLGEEREKFEAHMERYEQHLSNTFSALDTMLTSLKTTKTLLKQQQAIRNN